MPKAKDLVSVEFLKGHNVNGVRYNGGEIAGFLPDLAKELLKFDHIQDPNATDVNGNVVEEKASTDGPAVDKAIGYGDGNKKGPKPTAAQKAAAKRAAAKEKDEAGGTSASTQ